MLFNSPKQSPFLLIYPTMLFDSFSLHFIAFSYHGFLLLCFCSHLTILLSVEFFFKCTSSPDILNDSVMSHGNSDSAWQNIHLVNVVQAFFPQKTSAKYLHFICVLSKQWKSFWAILPLVVAAFHLCRPFFVFF